MRWSPAGFLEDARLASELGFLALYYGKPSADGGILACALVCVTLHRLALVNGYLTPRKIDRWPARSRARWTGGQSALLACACLIAVSG